MNSHITVAYESAAEKVREILARPFAQEGDPISVDEFDPWDIFPCLYGSYSSDFDKCALDVLRELQIQKRIHDDLGADMFREMLCTSNLCDYGTSPRVCFATTQFAELLSDLIAKWRDYARLTWGEDWDV